MNCFSNFTPTLLSTCFPSFSLAFWTLPLLWSPDLYSSTLIILSPTHYPISNLPKSLLIFSSSLFSTSKFLLIFRLIMDPDPLPKGSMLFGSWIMLYSLSTKVTPSIVMLPTVKVNYYYSCGDKTEDYDILYILL